MVVTGAPHGFQNVVIAHNRVADFGLNTGPTGHGAMHFEWRKGTVQWIHVAANLIELFQPQAAASAFYFEWADEVTTSGIVVQANPLLGVAVAVTGPQAESVEYVR